MCRLLLRLLFLWLDHNYCQFIIWNKRGDRGGAEEGVQRSGEVCIFLLSMGTCGCEGVRVVLVGGRRMKLNRLSASISWLTAGDWMSSPEDRFSKGLQVQMVSVMQEICWGLR